MFTVISPKVKAILEALTGEGGPIKHVSDHPVASVSGFPAVIFFPEAFDGDWLTSMDDMVGYRYRIFVLVDATNETEAEAWGTTLPACVDAVQKAFRDGWDLGTAADGHRIWAKLTNGSWYASQEGQGALAIAELHLTVNAAASLEPAVVEESA